MPLLLAAYPFAELYAWYKFIDAFSFLDAVALILTGGLLGFVIMVLQGRTAVVQTQVSLAQGKLPGNAILHRGLVMFGGLLIFLPGLLSKFAGFMMIMPGFRHLAVWYLKYALAGKVANGSFRVFMAGGFPKDFSAEMRPAERDVVDIQPTQIENKKYD